ncbi:lipid A biosynthesis acyltransferase [Diaphorobacter ruginosibacter]|uniref:Lipid A biosynthesis acyltransferase n=1 Tax=Diaphorobacter ruginosibacter TaxID=1715720 RepID=A0A7G9RQY5_9BURK|nr:lipid A biosynthesis acyltransferase [Diaphorobacter ruginosibacter]QNN58010.1 lipid A biosynthesis acyltransferase [Diaphorobacter ruginosibacter]
MSLSSLGVGMMHLLAKLPLPLLRALGKYVGRLLFVLAGQRRRVALRNLELCFPEMGESERRTLAKQTFEAFCQTFLDRSWLWFGSEALVRSRVRLEGAIDELEGDTPTIVFAPHFYSMDAGGLALPLNTEREFTSIFATNPDPVLDAWFMQGRQRFGRVRMLNRADGVKPIISCLRKGGLLYLLPDMDYGRNDSVFVPFFAVPDTATIPSLSRFARLGRAKVVALYNEMTPEGYVAHLTPAWENFPTEDHVADTARMNRELQAAIMRMPSQYYWVHKRFKTRPEGQPSLYERS